MLAHLFFLTFLTATKVFHVSEGQRLSVEWYETYWLPLYSGEPIYGYRPTSINLILKEESKYYLPDAFIESLSSAFDVVSFSVPSNFDAGLYCVELQFVLPNAVQKGGTVITRVSIPIFRLRIECELFLIVALTFPNISFGHEFIYGRKAEVYLKFKRTNPNLIHYEIQLHKHLTETDTEDAACQTFTFNRPPNTLRLRLEFEFSAKLLGKFHGPFFYLMVLEKLETEKYSISDHLRMEYMPHVKYFIAARSNPFKICGLSTNSELRLFSKKDNLIGEIMPPEFKSVPQRKTSVLSPSHGDVLQIGSIHQIKLRGIYPLVIPVLRFGCEEQQTTLKFWQDSRNLRFETPKVQAGIYCIEVFDSVGNSIAVSEDFTISG